MRLPLPPLTTILWTLATPASALAASATPDRPTVSATGYLVSAGSLEAELGGVWTGHGGVSTPLLVKYSYQGTVEPRVGVDLARFDDGAPGLSAGAKIKLVREKKVGLALYTVSNLPVGSAEWWWGSLRLLSDVDTGTAITLTINAGADLGAVSGTVGVVGVPVSVAASAGLFGAVSGFFEGAHSFANPGYGDVVDAGLGWRVTDAVVVDAAGGWSFDADDAYLTLGVTFNAGTLGG